MGNFSPELHQLTILARRSILLGLFVIVLSTFILFFAKNFGMYLAGAVIQQAAAGFISTVARESFSASSMREQN